MAEDLREVGIATSVQGLDAGSLASLNTSRKFDMVISDRPARRRRSDAVHHVAPLGLSAAGAEAALPGVGRAVRALEGDHHERRPDRRPRDMQELFNRQPTSIPLFYPDEYWAYRADRFAGWVESPGYGIVHKWSLLPR